MLHWKNTVLPGILTIYPFTAKLLKIELEKVLGLKTVKKMTFKFIDDMSTFSAMQASDLYID